MITREDVYSIGARIQPLIQMFYVKPPYTSHLEDAALLSADSAVASQKTKAEEAALLQSSVKQNSPFTLDAPQPEQFTGRIVTKQS